MTAGIECRDHFGKRLLQIAQNLTATVGLALAQKGVRLRELALEDLQHVPAIIGGVTKSFEIVGPVRRVHFHAQRFAEDRMPRNIK